MLGFEKLYRGVAGTYGRRKSGGGPPVWTPPPSTCVITPIAPRFRLVSARSGWPPAPEDLAMHALCILAPTGIPAPVEQQTERLFAKCPLIKRSVAHPGILVLLDCQSCSKAPNTVGERGPLPL